MIDHLYISKTMVATELFDHHGHLVSYLRLAVTDRCNLHCFYGIPEERVQSLPKKKLLAFEEIERLITLMVPKVRLTGGEPFVPVTTDGVSAAGLKEVLKLKKEGNMMHGDGVDVNPSRLI